MGKQSGKRSYLAVFAAPSPGPAPAAVVKSSLSVAPAVFVSGPDCPDPPLPTQAKYAPLPASSEVQGHSDQILTMASARRRSSVFCLLSSRHAVQSARMRSSAGRTKKSVRWGF